MQTSVGLIHVLLFQENFSITFVVTACCVLVQYRSRVRCVLVQYRSIVRCVVCVLVQYRSIVRCVCIGTVQEHS